MHETLNRKDKEELTPAQTKHNYRSLIALTSAMFCMTAGVGFIIPLLPVYAESLGASGMWIGFIFAANPFIRGILMLTIGALADQRGKKGILTLGLLGYLLASLGFILATGPLHLVVLRMLQGVFGALVFPIAQAYVGQLSPPQQEGKIMSFLNTGFFIGDAAGPLIGGLLADWGGFHAPFYAMAALTGLSTLLVYTTVPEQGPEITRGKRQTPNLAHLGHMLKSNTVKGLVTVHSLVGMGGGIFYTLLPLFGRLTLGFSTAEMGLVLTIRSLVSASLQPVCGWLADRYNRKWLAVCGFAIAPMVFILVPNVSSLTSLIALAVVLGAGSGLSVPASTAMAVGEGRRYGMGAMMGLKGMGQSFAMAIGSIAGGTFMDAMGMSWAFYLAALISLSGIGISLHFLRDYPPKTVTKNEAE